MQQPLAQIPKVHFHFLQLQPYQLVRWAQFLYYVIQLVCKYIHFGIPKLLNPETVFLIFDKSPVTNFGTFYFLHW